jgi:hypothetical protein
MYQLTIKLLLLSLLPCCAISQVATNVQKFPLKEAKQAVAVDKEFFYVINNSTITKHRKTTAEQVAVWDGTADSVKHLNSGVVIKGKLYCANSNYPQSPMAGSIEVFDAATLQHIGNHSFGIAYGSVTWIDQHDGFWWVAFAHYTGRGSSEGKDNRWSCLVKFAANWQVVESWIYPPAIIEKFGNKSNSGGVWGKDGLLYITGHDNPELYVMELPKIGFTLKHIKTIPVPVYGQGIAIDRSAKGNPTFYGLSRGDNAIIRFELQ